MKRSIEFQLEQFKEIIASYGAMSANAYDQLTIPKPSRSTLQRRAGRSWTELVTMATGAPHQDKQYQALIAQNKALAERCAKLKDLQDAFISTCTAEISKMQIAPVKVPKKETAKERLSFHSLRSDAHVGQYVDPDLTQGIGFYNVATFKGRLRTWARKVVTFREQDKNSLGLNKLVIVHLGDEVTGEDIYPGQAFSIDISALEQWRLAVEEEANIILMLAGVFPEVEVFCVHGNHGRPGRRGQHHPKTNFDDFVYYALQQVLLSQKNVKVFVSESPSMIVQHGKKVFLYNHGDAARGWMGIPFYGLERMYQRLSNLYGMMIDYECVAHHHQPANLGGRIYLNGSLVGGSDLSINKMHLGGEPTQKIFYFDDHHGINRESDLVLDEKPVLQADANGIYTPHSTTL